MSFNRWLYRGGRPGRLASLLNRGWAAIHALGLAPNYLVTLEVRGRQSGRPIHLPLVVAVVAGERYLVSMLGANANWVRNVQAAGGKARLLHGVRENVLLEVFVLGINLYALVPLGQLPRGLKVGADLTSARMLKVLAVHVRVINPPAVPDQLAYARCAHTSYPRIAGAERVVPERRRPRLGRAGCGFPNWAAIELDEGAFQFRPADHDRGSHRGSKTGHCGDDG